MLKTLTRYPTVLGASIFVLFGVVYAQVVPDEELVAQESPTEIEVEETVTIETTEASTTDPVIEEVFTATTSASSTEENASTTEQIATSTEVISEMMLAIETPVEKEINSLNDLDKPSHCQTDFALLRFRNVGECVRYVLAEASEERRENIRTEEPRYTPSGEEY